MVANMFINNNENDEKNFISRFKNASRVRREERMFCTVICQTLPRRSIRGMGRTAAHIAVALLLWSTPRVTFAQDGADVEKPPVLNVKELIPENLLQGQGFRVEEQVPTDGIMGTYTLIADKETFGEDAGTYQVLSREMAVLRLSEVPAIIKLNETSKVGTFAKSVASTAAQPLESAGNMVLHPVDTVTGLPSGVGRFFDRVGSGAGRLWDAATDPGKGGIERTGDTVAGVGSATKDVLGYEQERRELAKKLGVDPYTTNKVLAKKLNEIATTAFRARMGTNTVISVFVPASIILTGVKSMDNLVWDTPRGDLIVRVENKLQDLKVSPTQRSAFLHNAAFPLSLQVAMVENLARLGGVAGRTDVVALASTAATESQARFLATSVRMLADYHEKKTPITALAVPGPVVARDLDGTLVLPAPVDYVSWTERVATFAKHPSFRTAPQRTILLAGLMSPRAKQGFETNGWTVRNGNEP
jgi:hypothetical protein